MTRTVEAMGRLTSVNTTPDVFAINGRSGKTEQTASAKPSVVVTSGAQNKATSAVEKVTERARKLTDRLCHDEPECVPGDVFLAKNGIPVTG